MIGRSSLFAKYAIPLIVLVSGALIVSGLIQIYFSYQESKSALARIQYEKAAAAAIRIEQFARQLEHDLSWIAQTPWVALSDPLNQRRLDSLRLLRQSPAITEVSHIDPTGHEQLRVSRLAMDVIGSNADFSDDPKFADAMARKIYFSPIYFRKESEPYMTIAMTGATEDTGVVVAEANLKFIWDVVSNLKVGKDGNAYVVDERGRLIAHPDISMVLQKTDLSALAQVKEAAKNPDRDVNAPVEAMIGRDIHGTDVLSAHATIKPLNWTVFVDLPIAEAFAPLYASIFRTVLLVLAGVLVSAAASLYLVRRMVSPIQVLRTGAARIGAGALDHRIEVRSGDELQALADEFNGMTERLQASYAGLEREVEERTRDLTEALEQQTATAEILRVISESQTDVQPVFDTIAERARGLSPDSVVGVAILEGELVQMRALSGIGKEGEKKLLSAFPRPVDRSTVTSRAILERKVIAIEDISTVEHYVLKEAAEAINFRSAMAVPILREGRALGAIGIMRKQVGAFDSHEVKVIKTFADQAAIAIDNTRLFKELQSRTQDLAQSVRQLQSLAEVSQAVNSTLDLQEVLSAIVTRAAQLSNADGGVVYEYDETSEQFHARATYGYPPEFVSVALATPLRFDDGATGRAAATRAPVQIPDLRVEGGYSGPLGDETKRAGVLAVLAVPLLREEHILGSLVVSRNRVGEFPKEMVDVLQTFAEQSTLAIQNARLFREIEDKSHELEIASQHKSKFLANMSHELRTPLNAIIGFSEVLKDGLFGALAPKQDEYIRDIHASGHHLLSLINDILDLSKVEADHMELNLSNFNVPAAIGDALTLVRERANKLGVNLNSEIDSKIEVFTGDERKFKQIMLNLLSNAVKFTPAGGDVTVCAKPTADGLQVSVSDTGLGIAPEEQETIFNAFQQGDSGRNSAREGTGLGLTLARSFVELHNGRIWVESKESEGSTFLFTMVSQL
jgi:signal transduction histidine kinase/methyl-accepting chemotaxis protein